MLRYRALFWPVVMAVLLVVTTAGPATAGPARAADVGTFAASAGCGKAPTLTSGTHTIQSNGKSRSFILKRPDNYDSNRQYRLVFGFHWVGGTAVDVDTGRTVQAGVWNYYGLQRLANNSAIFVAPQGINNGWGNAGGEDVTFVDNMISRIEADLCVDTAQRFALGFSYGGAMTYALACARPTVFRAVAVYSAGQISGCSGGSQPVAYFAAHGIRDGVFNVGTGRSLRDRFVRNNGCAAQNPPEPAQGSLTHRTTAYSGCAGGKPVVWAAFDEGHIAAPQDGAGGDSGSRTWLPAETWSFFTQFGTTPPDTGIPTGWARITNAANGLVLDSGGAVASGSVLKQWSYDGSTNLQWQLVDVGGGYYRLVNRTNGMVADSFGNTGNGANAMQAVWNGSNNQQWRLASMGGGRYQIINRGTGTALDSGGGTAVGSTVKLWAPNTSTNMQWTIAATASVMAAGTLAASAGCGKAPTLNNGTQTIQSGGKSRSFILKRPDNYDRNRQYRLVFGFHWWGGTAVDVDTGRTVQAGVWNYYGLQRLANNTTIFVAPQGIGNGWANSGGEDLVFVDDMLRRIEADLCVDTSLRFAVGFSYGGAMSHALACARANVFRAVAVQSSPGTLSGCSGGTQPIAYLGVHGIGDNIAAGRSLRDRFVRNNGCTAQNPPEPAAGSLTHRTTTYSGCRAGYPVAWAAFDGGHIAAPQDGAGGDSGSRTWVPGEVWRFFTQFGGTNPDPGPEPGACRVTNTVSAWNTGLTSEITIANTGTAAIDGWSLVFTLPGGQTITSGWSASYSPTSGQVTARNVDYNPAIAAGASIRIGFQASHTGNTAEPTAYTLNGAACAVA